MSGGDVDARTEAARAAGAQVWMGPMDVLDAGRWALPCDPQGGIFGILKPPPAP